MVPAERPWFRFWPRGVPRHLEYPAVPVFALLEGDPELPALGCGGRWLTRGELWRASRGFAGLLLDRGIAPGDRVMLLLPNGLEFAICYYGALMAGAIVVPANPLSGPDDVGFLLRDADPRLIVTRQRLAALAGDRETVVVDGNGLLEELAARPAARLPRPDPEAVAAIVYTGGTTGAPRGVMLTHRNLVANAVQNAVWFGWGERDVVIGLLPLCHSWGATTCLNSPLWSRSRVVLLPRFDPDELLFTVEREGATVLYGAASMFGALLAHPGIRRRDLRSLRYVKAGAMPIPPELKRRWERETGVKMVLGYGLTEASPETHDSPPDRVKPGTVGVPLIDTDARVVDPDTGRELGPGEVGELLVRGPQVMRGYWRRPGETAAALRQGWLATGDLAVMDEEGYFRIVDRRKEIIKYKGYTVAPAEVEAVLCEHPGVLECAVVGRPDPQVGEVPIAFVVPRPGASLTPQELMELCAGRLAPYKRVREVRFVERIPKSPVGKVLRRLLRERAGAQDPGKAR